MDSIDQKKRRTALISGAAGGLGRALVGEYIERGYDVIAIDIDAGGLEEIGKTRDLTTRALDITDPGAISSLVLELERDRRDIDLLVCLAGIYDTFPVTEADPELFRKIISVNLFGVTYLVRGLLDPLRKSKGRVIVVSSESYKIQALFQPYMISKAALEAYCKAARQELALKGISLTVIRPGAIRTPLLKWMERPVDEQKYPVYAGALKKSWLQSVKMVGKMTDPKKVAGLILKASESKRPKRIYRINNSILLKFIALLPGRITEKAIIRRFRNREMP